MRRFLICDDNMQDAETLAAVLRGIAGENCEICTALTAAETLRLAETVPCTALFLDIELAENSSGISFAKKFADAYPQIPLVFFTGHIRYCEEIFTAAPAALLLKPPTEERVRNVLEILRQKTEKHGCLTLSAGKNTLRQIPFETISYIENIRRRLTVFDTEGQIIASCYGRKLSEIAPQLQTDFVCCHQSIYVNMQQVTAIRRYVLVLRNGRELPISQSRFRTVRKRWGDYLGGRL